MNEKKSILFTDEGPTKRPTVNIWRKNTGKKTYHPNLASIWRFHKAISNMVNNHQASIYLSSTSYEVEF